MRRRINLNIVVFGIGFVVMMLWLASSVVSFKQVEKPYKLTGNFENAFGVLPHAEVAYIGVPIGQVTRVQRVTGGVKVTMAIDRGKHIPRGSTANIQRKSAIGEQFIDFYAPKQQTVGGYYKSGDSIPRELTTVPLEFSEFLRSASALLGALNPHDVGTIVHNLSVGLDGREDSLRQLATAGDKLTSTLASRTEALDRISANGGKLTHVMAEHRASLGAILDNLAQLNAALAASKGDVATLLDQGTPLLNQLADLVGNHKAELDCDLKVLEVVVDHTSTPQQLAGLRALLTWAPAAFGAIWDTRDIEPDGVWVRVSPIQAPENDKPKQYDPPRPLPPVVPAPNCVSTVPPSGADYSPKNASKKPPIDGQSAGVGFGLALVAAALVVRSATRMTV
ncbi:MAG: phospholipid/cholesterol/gamma-HCH transport system substrate-binding protein [Actinomycetota bacterium]|jgi:phospholipid/cholesterol/gamma-HCH transport system substrate-binding protein